MKQLCANNIFREINKLNTLNRAIFENKVKFVIVSKKKNNLYELSCQNIEIK